MKPITVIMSVAVVAVFMTVIDYTEAQKGICCELRQELLA